MARRRIADLMMSHRFWLMDMVPSIVPPFFVLGSPFYAFSSISSPEYSTETGTVKQINSMFKKYVYEGGEVSPITLQRGVRAWDDSMYEWMRKAITGKEAVHRHLMLIQYMNMGNALADKDVDSGILNAFIPSMPGGISFVPGKMWLLWNCIPTRYKAASDFEASSTEVSIAELEIQPEAFVEFTPLDTQPF